jgi:hypothetical protein
VQKPPQAGAQFEQALVVAVGWARHLPLTSIRYRATMSCHDTNSMTDPKRRPG